MMIIIYLNGFRSFEIIIKIMAGLFINIPLVSQDILLFDSRRTQIKYLTILQYKSRVNFAKLCFFNASHGLLGFIICHALLRNFSTYNELLSSFLRFQIFF